MKSVRSAFGILFVAIVAVGIAAAEEKKEIDKTKLIGKWKVVKAEGVPPGTIIEFMKDGKFVVSIDMDGNKITLDGTYSIEGDKLHTTMKLGEKENKNTDTLKTLTAEKLSLVDKEGKVAELEKVK